MTQNQKGHAADGRRVVAEIRATATRAGRAKLGACSLEGTRLFERALRAGARIRAAVSTAEYLDSEAPRVRAVIGELVSRGCPLTVIPDDDMEALTGGRSIGAIVGLADLPAPTPLADLLAAAGGAPPFFLGCLGVDDPGNIGALTRTAHASGARALLTVGACDAFHPKAVRTSMGSIFRLPVIAREELGELLEELSNHGVRCAGSVSENGSPLAAFPFGCEPWAVFLGSEAFGLSADQRAAFDALLNIPMSPGVDSLSVNAAAAVLLWELRRGI